NTERPLKPYYYNNSPNKMRFQVHYQVWISAHVAKGTESILKKRSARLYRWIFPSEKGIKKIQR
ncbi:hypothetical protein AB4Z30_27735, partial [Paenibacillus sp. 2TAF8]|uniref:hypothetical protein n=1 Tax=Paenibacillus sp. 2TAF8 TaxID=3233020 RepID=UPI003F97DAE9